MKIDKNTNLCISIASQPGNFGAEFHNFLYEYFKLNWIYKPCKVGDGDLEKIVNGVISMGIVGCSVSMPHKEKIMNYLDEVDTFAESIGSVNTVTQRKKGYLKGYNTDYYGAFKSIKEYNINDKNVLLIGAGGVAKSIGLAVSNLGGKLVIANRTLEKAIYLSDKLKSKYLDWNQINQINGCLLINATPIGMKNKNNMIVNEKIINNFEVVMDVVVNSYDTKMIETAKKLNKKIIPGVKMCLYQAIKQFEIYTGVILTKNEIDNLLNKYKL